MAQSVNGEILAIWISSLVFGGLLTLLAFYLIWKSFKVRQRNFFILTGLLAIIGAVSAALFIWFGR